MPEHPGNRRSGPVFYGRRRGKKLRQRGQSLIEELLPRLALRLPEAGRLDPFALFPRPVSAVRLEVGFGGGEHLAAQAAAHPEVGFIGSEVFVNGIASLLRHVEERGLDNVRIFADDVRTLFPALPDACLDGIFVLFPDPWPKKRHAERRFIGPGNLPELARLLRDGGELRVASDDPTYQEWAIDHLSAHPDFASLRPSETWRTRPEGWPPTRYEAKAIAAGRPPAYLSFLRKAR